jgi:hypothetical protein
VQPKEKLNYERAIKKPLEFMEKFDDREVVHKKVKQGVRVGSYTYSESLHSKKFSQISARAVILKSKPSK